MPDFSQRSLQAEWMDGEQVSAADFSACLTSLARVNTVTLARPPTLSFLARATVKLRAGAGFSLIDVGFGDGDMLRVIAGWSKRRGLLPTLIGYDLNPRSAPVAESKSSGDAIEFRTGDARSETRPVDFVISSLTTHHMTREEIVNFLRWMEATARRGWFINDLHRHWIAYHGFRLIAWAGRFHAFVKHDGPISVARSFRRAEWVGLLREADLAPEQVQIAWRFPFRLCVARYK